MPQNLIHAAQSLLLVAGHTLIIYLFLIAGLRAIGHRQMGQLTEVDLAVIIVLGSAVETAMVAGNTSLPAGLVSAGTLLLTNRLLSVLMLRSQRLRGAVLGGPTLLVHYGRFVEEHLRRAGLTEADVMEGIRERGVESLADVKFAVLEADGAINVVPANAPVLRTRRPVRGHGEDGGARR